MNAAFSDIYDKGIAIDVLINNAGTSTSAPFEKRTVDDFDKVMGVNLKGTFLCIQAYINQFDVYDQQVGSIVNVGSIFGVMSSDFRNYIDYDGNNPEVYGATKAGIIQMTKYFAVHLADRNIRVNCVSPGGIFNDDKPQGPEFVKSYNYRVPMKRMAKLSDMTGALHYFSSESASYTTGQNLVIDGGLTAW